MLLKKVCATGPSMKSFMPKIAIKTMSFNSLIPCQKEHYL